MLNQQENHSILAHSQNVYCPITQQRVSVKSYKEFLTLNERTIWWYCQVCGDWHILSYDSVSEGISLNLAPPNDDMMTSVE